MDDRPYFCCLVCGFPLEPTFDDDDDDDRQITVYHGLHFQAHGTFGTTVFDPSPNDKADLLEIVVCDWCLIEKQAQVRLFMKDGSIGSFSARIAKTVGPGERPEPAK